jgi:hypothetical protein
LKNHNAAILPQKGAAMQFVRFERLGEMKFRRITNELKRGTPVILVARLVQQEWGECQEVPEDTLVKQLQWLKKCLSDSLDEQKQFTREESVRKNCLGNSGHGCLEQLIALAIIDNDRIEGLRKKEQRTGCIIAELDKMIDRYAKLLETIQGLKFDLGVDKYMRSTPEKLWLEIERLKREQGESQRQCVMAYAEAEKVFERLEKRRKIGDGNQSR